MQNLPNITPGAGRRWGAVLSALYRASKPSGIPELVQVSGQDEAEVQKALVFLQGQGWADQLADGPEWVCTPLAAAVMQSLEKRLALFTSGAVQ